MTAGLDGRCPAGGCLFTNRKKPVAATRRNGTAGQLRSLSVADQVYDKRPFTTVTTDAWASKLPPRRDSRQHGSPLATVLRHGFNEGSRCP